MQIETTRLFIRRFEPWDIAELAPILTDPETMVFWPRPLTEQEAEQWLANHLRRYREDGFGRSAVVLKATNAIIGDCGVVKSTILDEPVNDLGYIFHASYWGQGYATEAARAAAQYAFTELSLDVLHANMPYNHLASKRVAEKIGMTFVKEFDNPRNRDIRTLLYAMRRP